VCASKSVCALGVLMKRSCRGFRCPALVEPPDYFCPTCRENRKSACREAGCPKMVSWPDVYCPLHKLEHGRERGSASSRGYGARWRAIRVAKLTRDPLCEECDRLGMTQVATEVHHKDGDPANCAADNLQSLCRRCHERTKR
jgi:5-methylcytosine-specific restriction protein A